MDKALVSLVYPFQLAQYLATEMEFSDSSDSDSNSAESEGITEDSVSEEETAAVPVDSNTADLVVEPESEPVNEI